MPLKQVPIDYNDLRKSLIREVAKVTGLDNNHVLWWQPETQDVPRPSRPYVSVGIPTPSSKFGDDNKDYDSETGQWNSGGVRRMTVAFEAYGSSHEEAYNYAAVLQTALDMADIQADLRAAGMAVWTIGGIADLSQLLNTGYEGRARLEVQMGISMNLQSDLGYMKTVNVTGEVDTGDEAVSVTTQVVGP